MTESLQPLAFIKDYISLMQKNLVKMSTSRNTPKALQIWKIKTKKNNISLKGKVLAKKYETQNHSLGFLLWNSYSSLKAEDYSYMFSAPYKRQISMLRFIALRGERGIFTTQVKRYTCI